MAFGTKLCILKPVLGILIFAIRHVFAAENAHFQHLLRGYTGREVTMKVLPHRLCKIIYIVFLHQVVYDHLLLSHDSILRCMLLVICPLTFSPSYLLTF